MINTLKKEKLIITLIILGFFFSVIKINSDLSSYDKYFEYDDGTNYHAIIRSPPEMKIWERAAEVKNKLSLNDLHPYEFRHHFLPTKILGLFARITDIKFYENESKKIYSSGGNKFTFFIFQTVIYYLSVIFLYTKLKKLKIENFICSSCIFFLIFEPSINQFQSTILAETIFFSLIIFIFSFLIDLPKKNLFYLFYGLLIGICYLQRSVAIFLITVPIIYIIVKFKKESILKVINLIIGFVIVLLMLGTINYNRTKIFYVLPTQTIDTIYDYFLIGKKGPTKEAELNKIIEENNLDINIETDRIKYHKVQREIAIKEISENKVKYIFQYIINSIHSTLLNPIEIRNVRIDGKNYYKGELHQKWIKYRIAYSIFIYFFIIIGIFYTLKEKILIPNLFACIGISIFFISGWVGYTRYFVPTFLCLSLYFSYGTYFLFRRIYHK